MSSFNVVTDKIIGKIKPMHAVNNGPLGGPASGKWELMKEAGIPFARLHDTGGAYGGHVYVDIANVFRNFDADASNPENYDFAFTDWLMKSLVDNGAEPFYRLGSTIENAHWVKPYNIFPPKDNMQWARICEGIIKHYTQGWGNGFNYKMTYWEIWNEPDNEPEIKDNPMWKGTKEQYFELYRVTANYLKEKFPHLKIGGYASCGFYKIADIEADPNANISPRIDYFITFFEEFLQYITNEKTKAPLDFFSWHSYSGVHSNIIFSNYARETLDKYGLTQTEHLCNEWNPGIKLRGTLRDATNIAANMLALHETSISMMMYYDWRLHCAYNGAINPLFFVPFKAFYSFKGFNELYRLGNQIMVETDEKQVDERVYCMAAKGEDGIAIMLVNYTDNDADLTISVDGQKDFVTAQTFMIDEDKTYEDIGGIKGGKLALKKDAIAVIKIAK